MFTNKLKAFSIHLLLSLILVSVLMGLVIYFWFPLDYLGITSFKDIALLIIAIDLVLGPVLTFIVFNPKKKSLKFDLAAIVAFQFIAMTYGVYALYQTHPLFVTYKQGVFNLVNANEITPENAKYNEFKISKLSSAKLAFTKLPDNPKEKLEIMMGVDFKGEPDIDRRAEFYEPYENHLDTILANSLDAVKLFSGDKLDEPRKNFLTKYKEMDSFAFLPLQGSGNAAIIVLDKKTAKPVTTIHTNPWKYVKSP